MINSYCPIVTLIGSNEDVDEIKEGDDDDEREVPTS